MSINKIYVDETSNLKTDLVDKYLGNVDDNLKNNPVFMEQLYSAIKHLNRKTVSSQFVPPAELYVSDDGKTVEIREGIRPNPDCLNDDLKNNKCYEQVSFSIDKENNLSVTTSSGSFYNFNDFMKACKGSKLEKQLSMFNSYDTPTVCSVYHKNKIFLESGIEVALSTYSDNCPLGSNAMDSEVQMRSQTMLHSPKKWCYNLVPEHASFELNPSRTNAHRFIDNLGIVYLQDSNGVNSPVHLTEYLSSTEYPDHLNVNPTPIFEFVNGKPILNEAYQKYYPGMNEYEIKKAVNIGFLDGIEGSKTKDINPQVYDSLKKLVETGLEARYGYVKQEDNTDELVR